MTQTVHTPPTLNIKPEMENIWRYFSLLDGLPPTTTAKNLPYIPPLGYATPGSVGIDLPLQYDIELSSQIPMFIDLGFQCAVPDGFMLALVARSGVGAKCGITPRNKIGIIDQDYRGNLGLIASMDTYGELVLKIASNYSDVETIKDIRTKSPTKKYKRGDCIAQAILIPVTQAEVRITDILPTPEEGRIGGFGSSNR